MLISRKNLLIAVHCAGEPDSKGRIINHLQITGTATVATNGIYSIAVSLPGAEENIKPFYISPDLAKAISATLQGESIAMDESFIGPNPIPPVNGKFPILEGFCADKPAAMEIDFSAKYLLAIAQALVDFGGDIARIKIISPVDPIRLESRNPITGQKWEALLMGHKPGAHDARFAETLPPAQQAEPAPLDPVQAAIREAERLMGI